MCLLQPTGENWEMSTLLPQEETNVLQWSCCVDGNKLLVCYMQVCQSLSEIASNLEILYKLKALNVSAKI